MATIKIPGDWSPPLVFALAGLPLWLVSPEPGTEALPGKATLGLVYLGLAVFFSIAAFRGRTVPDGARFYYWKSLDTSFGPVVFSALLLFFGSGALLMGLAESSWYLLFFGIGLLIFTYSFSLSAHITVFNKDKTFWTMIGKPWSFTRRYKASDFEGLVMTTDFAYAGQYGMIRSWQRHYYIFAVHGKKSVLVMQDNTIEEARKSLEDLTRLTGLHAIQEEPEEAELLPDLRVEIGGKKVALGDLLAKASHPIDTLTQLQAKYPEARVLKELPKKFPTVSKKKREFTGDHFVALLRAAKIPHYLHTSTPDQTDIWYFQKPLILPLKILKPFEDFDAYNEAYPKHFMVFTHYTFPQGWETFDCEPDHKYPPHDADEETQLFWARQGKDK